MHAIIIEDDYLIAQSIQDLLSGLGFTAFSFARSEDAAVAGAAEQSFDLITADARLVPGDGIRAVETICAGRPIPVIFVTGYAEDIHNRVHGALVVGKPLREPEFRAAVAKALASRRERPSERAPNLPAGQAGNAQRA